LIIFWRLSLNIEEFAVKKLRALEVVSSCWSIFLQVPLVGRAPLIAGFSVLEVFSQFKLSTSSRRACCCSK